MAWAVRRVKKYHPSIHCRRSIYFEQEYTLSKREPLQRREPKGIPTAAPVRKDGEGVRRKVSLAEEEEPMVIAL